MLISVIYLNMSWKTILTIFLVIEFGRQRRKFDLRHPIDIGLLENQIKSTFGIDHRNNNDYLIQIYVEEVHDYLDLTSNSLISTNNNLIKGQIIPRQLNSHQIQSKVSKRQVVGLITLESCENSLQKWSQLLQRNYSIYFIFNFSFRYSS